ncbi:peroxisome assembly protein 12 [Trichogramma pretiosum]|uniref:peroxisome assembly protein 12 n=1 Tax=Trichogramma pretiosum TaxID=7493 RepID=UPI0006C9B401|nr:peroxisome assembly protein 12 [Trichogramma pretiosum]
MAERGAHLTGTLFAKPSIFEIAAHKSLAATLEPAARKLITFIASANPDKYSWVYKWSDEIHLIFIAALQNYYLKNYSASFSETFYGLKRIVLKDSNVQLNLDKKRLNTSLIILVIFPYLQKKIDNWANENNNLVQNQKSLVYYLYKAYRILCSLKELATFYQYLLYLSNRSKFPTISLRLLSISLTYGDDREDIGLIDLLKKLPQGNFSTSDGMDFVRLSIVRSIEVGAFFLQFLQWWNQEHYYNLSLMALPVPPPPQIPEYAKRYKGICPICYRSPRIHTVLATSGFIYCYSCIITELRKNKKCPVTGYPAKEDQLVRLYLQE